LNQFGSFLQNSQKKNRKRKKREEKEKGKRVMGNDSAWNKNHTTAHLSLSPEPLSSPSPLSR
jgi:hypothetical protein